MVERLRNALPSRLALVATLAVFAACEVEPEPAEQPPAAAPGAEQPAVPSPAPAPAEPAPDLVSGIEDYIRMQGGGAVPAFRYGTVDLNGDGRLESIVLLQGAEWCRAGGCRLLVFRGDDEGALLVSSVTAAAEPVRISTERTGGWHDLIVRSEGKGDVVLRFDGTGYPSNPSMQPQATPEQVEAAQELPMTQVEQPTTSR